MAEILDNAAHLAQSIGPRPAGTEEERQAALYISEALQRKAGLPTEVEDFTCATDFELPRAIYCLVAVLLTILTFFLPVLIIVAFVVTLIMAALYAVETLVRPLLAPMMSHGMSQNVVARYEPAPRAEGAGRAARQRKVVLLAHYDTGKVRAEVKPAIAPLLPIVSWAEVGAMALLALLLLLRLVSTPTGGFAIVITALTAIACVVALIPAVVAVMHRTAPYTDGANCNAAGVAVMIEVAKRLKKGHERAQEMQGMEVRVHGEDAARASGLVPEGTTLSYETQATEPASGTAEDRLMAAKAAVAMLTGKPVSATVNIDLDEPPAGEAALVQDAEGLVAEEEGLAADAAMVAEAAEEMAASVDAADAPDTAAEQPVTFTLGGAAPAPAAPEVAAMPTVTFGDPAPASDGVPDWFKAARAKARKNPGVDAPVSRSRYAEAAQVAQEAIDARNATLEAQAAAAAESRAMTETEARLAQVRESIMEQHPVRSAPPAEGASDAALREEVSTVAFAPVEINGEDLRREAQKQKEADRAHAVEAVGAVAEPSPAGASAQPQEPAPAPAAAAQKGPSDRAADSKAAARIDSLRKSIPLVSDPAAPAAEPDAAGGPAGNAAGRSQTSEEQKARQDALRQILPSLSGSIKASPEMFAKAAEERAASSSEKTDAFSPVEATRVFEPVTEATAEVLDAADIVEDADDSSYDGQLTETGAYTGREYVEMPQGRASRFFGKFRRGKKAKGAEETSAAEWLDVEEGYDARERGEQLGEWSTRNHYGDGGEAEPSGAFADYDDIDDYDDDDIFAESDFRPRSWNGGVFSKESLEKVRGMVKKGGSDAAADADGPSGHEGAEQDASAKERSDGRRKRRAAGVDVLFADTSAPAEPPSAERPPAAEADLAPEPVAAAGPLDDVQAVHDFRLPDIGMEVWFVALGAELAGNSGMKDFLATHRDELKGAIFVDLEALGAGSIASIGSEGMYFPVKPSSRMGRYARKAASALGIHVGEASMLWRDTAATVALRQGSQAMHFAGMTGDLPAYAASKDDKLEHLSEDTMLANADFIVELLKQI